jgi:hypothetical protein
MRPTACLREYARIRVCASLEECACRLFSAVKRVVFISLLFSGPAPLNLEIPPYVFMTDTKVR